jgi:hypothetical protein
MILLASTSALLRVITSAAVPVDVHASWVDLSGSTVTPGQDNTQITTASSTTVIPSPGASTARNVKGLLIRNKSATTGVMITIEHTDGATTVEIEKRWLSPGQNLRYIDAVGFEVQSGGEVQARPWFGQLAAAYGDGNPDTMLALLQDAGNVAPTPTNIATTVARCSMFRLPFDLTVASIRWYGVGATTNVFRVALYRLSDLARLMPGTAITTVANAWGAVTGLSVALARDETYFLACSVNATGTVAGPAAFGGTIAAATGQIQSAPSALPGSLATKLGGYQFQFAVTTGALPDPAPALAAQAAWTGGMPAFFLDSA